MRALIGVSWVAGLMIPVTAHALVILQQARSPLSVEYDSNPTMASGNKSAIWRYTLNPGYKITAGNSISSWFLDAGLNIERTSNNNISIDREDPSISAGWWHEFERGKLAVTTNYAEASTRVTEFERTGLVQKDGSSKSKSINVNGSRQLTERLSLTAGADYRKLKFSGSELGNYSSRGINLGLTYLYNEKISPFLRFSLSNYRSEDGSGIHTVSKDVTVGANILLTPQLSTNFGVGTNTISSGGSGWIGNAGLTYEGNRHHYTATYARSVNATGAGGFQESDRVSLGYVYDLSEISSIGADYSFSRNNSINSLEAQRLAGWYSRQLTQYWDLKVTLQRKELKGNGSNAEAEVVGITVNYQWPEF